MSETTDALPYPHPAFLDTIAKRPMLFIGPILLIVAATAAVVGILGQRDARAGAANNLLYQAEKDLAAESKVFAASVTPAPTEKPKSPLAKPADPEDVLFKKADVTAKFPKAVEGFRAVIDQYPGTRAAFEAELSLGSLFNSHGDPAQATQFLQKAVLDAPKTFDEIMALNALAAAQEGTGKYADAAASYQGAITKLPSTAEPAFRAGLMMSLARSLELKGDKAQARSTYDQIIAQTPESSEAREAALLKALIP